MANLPLFDLTFGVMLSAILFKSVSHSLSLHNLVTFVWKRLMGKKNEETGESQKQKRWYFF